MLRHSRGLGGCDCAIASGRLLGCRVLVVGRLIKRTGHTSIIVFILAFLIVAGTVLTAVFGGMRCFQEWRDGQSMGFKPFCGH